MAAFTVLVLAPDKGNRDRGTAPQLGVTLTCIDRDKFVHQRNQDFKYQSIPKQEISTQGRGIFFFSYFLGCLRDVPG